MKQNDAGDFTIIYTELGDQRTDLFQTVAIQKKPVVIVPASQAGVLQKPDDFTLLKYVKRQADLPIIFILPHGSQQAQLAARNGFPVYQSMDALLDTLSIGQIAKARITRPFGPSRSPDTSNMINAPHARRGTSPVPTKPLFPDEDSQEEVRGSRRISQPLTPIPPSFISEERRTIYPDQHRPPPPDVGNSNGAMPNTSNGFALGTNIHTTDRNTTPLAPKNVGARSALGTGSAQGIGLEPRTGSAQGTGQGQALSTPTVSGEHTLSEALFYEHVVIKPSVPPRPLIELSDLEVEEDLESDQPTHPMRSLGATHHTPVKVEPAPTHRPSNTKNLSVRWWQAHLPGKRRLLFVLICVLVIAITGSFLVLPRFSNGAASIPPTNGHLVFTSSGQVSETGSQGVEDQVTLDLTNIATPATGKALYAWLLGDKRQNDPRTILLGKLQLMNNGTAHLFYPGDAQHTSLLLTMSRTLVTEEDSVFPPIAPSPDQGTWRYYSEFSSTPINAPDNTKQFSFLDHLRHLLAADPTLDELELPGGLNKWLYNNTSKVKEWVDSIRQQWEETKDTDFVHRQLERALQFLDGNTFVYLDIPPETPLLVNERLARVGLINVTGPNQEPPDYLDHISHHLNGLLEAKPTPAIRQKIGALITALGNVNQWLKQAQQDAQQLMKMSDDQLMQQDTLSVINDMIANVDRAYSGQPDPSTNTMKEGVDWIHNQMQFLATLDITPWDGTNSSPTRPNKIAA
jgi:hypothetical protein